MDTWKKDIVKWSASPFLYLSVVFTWLLPKAEAIARAWDGPVIAGGPAVYLMGAPWADETYKGCAMNVLALHNLDATFTTRGCIRSCPFCAVPKIEGEFRELESWKPAPIICDNNFLAASKKHVERVIDSLVGIRNVDFNQGLDARLFTRWHADQISRLKLPFVRFAFDHISQEGVVADAVKLARNTGVAKNRMSVYVLVGFNDTPDDARYRLEFVRSLGIRPWPMRYQPLDSIKKNSCVGSAWTRDELAKMVRYYSRLNWTSKIPYDEFNNTTKKASTNKTSKPTTEDDDG